MNYEVDEFLLQDFSGRLEDYSMVILHQLPGLIEPADALLKSIREKKTTPMFWWRCFLSMGNC